MSGDWDMDGPRDRQREEQTDTRVITKDPIRQVQGPK